MRRAEQPTPAATSLPKNVPLPWIRPCAAVRVDRGAGEYTEQDDAEGAADAVDAPNVECVVPLQPRLDLDGEVADQPRRDPDQRRTTRSGRSPAAGVMHARPATAPVRSPTKCGFFPNHHSTNSQVVAAKDAARSVLRNASEVMSSTFSSLPALKPYQPNQSSPVPSAMNGMLCGESRKRRLPDVEHRRECGPAGARVDDDPAGEVADAPLLRAGRRPRSCARTGSRRRAARRPGRSGTT